MLDVILGYARSVKGLTVCIEETRNVSIVQKIDGRKVSFESSDVEEVLDRKDVDGKAFLQVNFLNGRKILITESLVGFKPIEIMGLDLGKLPRVVTTPDLVSVFEAIEEALGSENTPDHEVETLRKVFYAILNGAENIGFSLENERKWLSRLSVVKSKVSA